MISAKNSLFGKPERWASIALGAISLLAVGVPSLIVSSPQGQRLARPVGAADLPIVPPQVMPQVDPVRLVDLAPADARAINAAVPFSTARNPAARPFRLEDTGNAAMRAIDCLSTAILYEAGDDTTGERAVAQVIINRVRHPAFPKTICGVVFQGAERRTGCQFTFTCDGALLRHRWSDAAWARARNVATQALNGAVFDKVGHATHYHTDWVVPYWSASLDKVSAVGTHLFFRWTGWWGTPPAFNRQVSGDEPVIAQLGAYFQSHRAGGMLVPFGTAVLTPGELAAPSPVLGEPDLFLVTIDRRADPESLRKQAEASCGASDYCKYMAWSARGRTPTSLPLEPFQIATMSFSYLRDRLAGFDKALWNCTEFPRADPRQCMKKQAVALTDPADGDDAIDSAGGSTYSKALSEHGKLVDPAITAVMPVKNKRLVSGSLQPAAPARTPGGEPTASPNQSPKPPAP